MPKKSKRKAKVKGLVDKLEEIPDLDMDPTTGAKMYHVREIDYLAYNTLFSIQQLLNTLNLLADQQRETIQLLSRINSKLDEYLIPEEVTGGDKGITIDVKDEGQTDEVGEGGTTED